MDYNHYCIERLAKEINDQFYYIGKLDCIKFVKKQYGEWFSIKDIIKAYDLIKF